MRVKEKKDINMMTFVEQINQKCNLNTLNNKGLFTTTEREPTTHRERPLVNYKFSFQNTDRLERSSYKSEACNKNPLTERNSYNFPNSKKSRCGDLSLLNQSRRNYGRSLERSSDRGVIVNKVRNLQSMKRLSQDKKSLNGSLSRSKLSTTMPNFRIKDSSSVNNLNGYASARKRYYNEFKTANMGCVGNNLLGVSVGCDMFNVGKRAVGGVSRAMGNDQTEVHKELISCRDSTGQVNERTIADSNRFLMGEN